MLVLSRKINESIMIGDDVELVVIGVEGDTVRLGIKAPKQVDIYRKEVYLAIKRTNEEAVQSVVDEQVIKEWFASRIKGDQQHNQT
jgi:carbon storage regulator (csrA)